MEFIFEEPAAYTQGGVRDTGGTRRKSGGKVGEEEKVEERGRGRNWNKVQQRSKEKDGGCEPSPRFSYDLPVT